MTVLKDSTIEHEHSNDEFDFWGKFKNFIFGFDTPFKIAFSSWICVMILILLILIVWKIAKIANHKKQKSHSTLVTAEIVKQPHACRLPLVSQRTDHLSGILDRDQMRNMYHKFPSNVTLVQSIMADKSYWDAKKQSAYNSL